MPCNSSVVICGDFNFPSICWSNIDPGLSATDSCVGIFLNFYFKHAMHQFVSQPTRTTLTSSSILDLILCNDVNFIFNPRARLRLALVIIPVDFNLIHCLGNSPTNIASYNFDGVDWSRVYVLS